MAAKKIRQRGPSLDLEIPEDLNFRDLDAKTLLGYVEGLARVHQSGRANLFRRNERWYHGDQWADHEYEDTPQWNEWDPELPTIEDNLLPNATETVVARLLEMNPVAVFFARRGVGADPVIARVANRIVEHYSVALEWHRKVHDTARNAYLGGHSGLKTYWNDQKGYAADSLEPEGDLALDKLTCLDFATDGREEVDDQGMLYCTTMVDRAEAYAMLKAAGYSGDKARRVAFTGERSSASALNDPDIEQYLGTTGGADVSTDIRATEVWFKRSPMFPKGRYVAWIGDTVVENMEHPYEHGELPYGRMRWRIINGSDQGTTPFDSMVKIQRAHNEALSIRSHRVYEFRFNWVWGEASSIRQMRGHSAFIERHQDDKQKPEIITAEPHLEDINTLITASESAMDKAAGVPALLNTGEGFNTTTVGKSMGYLNFAVQLKSIPVLREVWCMTERLFKQWLQLVQENYTLERLVRLLGEGTELEAELFLKADLKEGYVLLPQVGHGDLLSRVARAAETQAAAAEGRMDPARAAELGQTGLTETEDEEWSRIMVHEAARKVLEGGDAVVPDDVDAGIAVRELRRIIPTYVQAEGVDGLREMLSYFEEEMFSAPAPGAMGAPLPQPAQGAMMPPEEMVQ